MKVAGIRPRCPILLAAGQGNRQVMSAEKNLSVEEKMVSLFQPDTLLPAEYFETFRRKTHLEPEKKLMLAVLDDAIACFQKHVSAREGPGKKIFGEAEEWFLKENSEWPFSFENICEVLGINPSYLRQGLIRCKEMHLAQHPKAKIYRLTSRKEQKLCENDDANGSTDSQGSSWLSKNSNALLPP